MDRSIIAFIVLLALSLIVAAVAIAMPIHLLPSAAKVFIILIALAIDIFALMNRYYYFIFVPALTQRSQRVVLSEEPPYTLAESGEAILRRTAAGYTATVYINIPYYRSATEMRPDEKLEFARQVGRLVGMRQEPVRFSTSLHLMDKEGYITEIKNAIAEAETERSSAPPNDKLAVGIAEGKAEMWRNVLAHIVKEESLEMLSIAAVSADGGKESEAIELAQHKASEIISAIGANFGVTATLVTGEGLSKVIDPEYLIPYTTVREKIEEQIIEEIR